MSDIQFTEFDMATKTRVVIVGVGFAGAFAETALSMRNEFRRVDTRSTRVLLLDFADRVLTAFHPALSARAKRDFEGMGIEVILNTRVTEIDDKGLTAETEDGPIRIDAIQLHNLEHSSTILWGSGGPPDRGAVFHSHHQCAGIGYRTKDH